MVKLTEGVSLADALARTPDRRVLATLAMVAMMAGCASPHPAPIVHRTPTERAPSPAPVPAARAPIAAVPASPAAGSATGGPLVVETTPVPTSRVESRPLPGSGGTIAVPPPPASSNLLKTEPRAGKQPYSDALLSELKSAVAPGVVAPTAPAPPAAPAPAAPAPAAASAPAAAPPPAASPAPSSSVGAPTEPQSGDFVWPAAGKVVQGFAEPRSMGITIAGKPGDPIVAVADGRVIFSGSGPRGYGNLVIVKHANETLSVYGHNRTLLVKEGQSVKRGQSIAELGSSGADSPQLRFEIRKDGKPVDPRKYLPAR